MVSIVEDEVATDATAAPTPANVAAAVTANTA